VNRVFHLSSPGSRINVDSAVQESVGTDRKCPENAFPACILFRDKNKKISMKIHKI